MISILVLSTTSRPENFDQDLKIFLKCVVDDCLTILVKHIFNVISVKIGITQNARKLSLKTSTVINNLAVEDATKTIYNLKFNL